MLRVGFLQFRPIFGRVDYNLARVVNTLKSVSVDIMVLPELPFSGYYFKDRQEVIALAEEVDKSNTIETLINLCRQADFYLVTGFAEKSRDKYFNSAVILGPEGVKHVYRKLQLFDQEKFWFDAGDIPLQVNTVRGAKIGVMVCFDWIFPEIFRSLSLMDADIICHPSNLVLSYCQQTMITRCLENAVFAITANRFGADRRPHGELIFTGKSQIVAPKGELLFRAPSKREILYITEIDLNLTKDKQLTAHNHLFEDRRPDFYKLICR